MSQSEEPQFFIESLEALSEKISQVPSIQPLNIDLQDAIELVNSGNLNSRIQQLAKEYMNVMIREGSNSKTFYSFVELLYKLFILYQESPKSPILQAFRTFETFLNTYFPDRETSSYSYGEVQMAMNIEKYISQILLPKQKLILIGDKEKPVYSINPGPWILLPKAESYSSLVEVVTQDVFEEVIGMFEQNYNNSRLVMHSSGSSALDSIGEIGLVSARSAIKQEKIITTGEHITNVSVHSPSFTAKRGGSGTIFSTRTDTPFEAYTFIRWFNEFPVTFGIDLDKQIEFLDQEKIMYKDMVYNPETMDFEEAIVQLKVQVGMDGADERLLGPKVPFENMRYVYVRKNNMDEIRIWLDRHQLSHIIPISYEAAETYRMLKPLVEHYISQGFSPREVLTNYMDKGAIT